MIFHIHTTELFLQIFIEVKMKQQPVEEIIKFKDALSTLGLVLFNDNANRDKYVFFCAIASANYIE
ncbi:hypothetical protein C4513_17415 [Morganella morganii]|nr:hypothetical protein DR96_4037 [Providencia stuartii]MQC12618.1 hypothetical protein [Morganella morganii]